MTPLNLHILSYHRFVESNDYYPFSRTYEQFWHDIRKKEFDMIAIDDGRKCQIKACEMMRELNIRAKLFVSTALIDTPGYCTWDDLRMLSEHHDIENHSHDHIYLTELTPAEVESQLIKSQALIEAAVNRKPRFFVAPWNQYNETVDKVVAANGLQSLKDRVNILNNTR